MSRKALLVGINKYRIPGSDLWGCVNDVTNVRDCLLKFFGFCVEEIRVLVDERATKRAMMERLRWLVRGAKGGDTLLFHFSGHGSQVRDRDGDELRDHLDEILCPHDMDWDGTYITDDELRGVFSGLPQGALLEVWLDCCHAGTGTREAFAMERLPPELSTRPRFLAPPVDIQARVDEDLEVRRILRGVNPLSHVLFAGCRDNQTSADAFIGGYFNGAFTYYVCKNIRDAGGVVSRSDLLKRVRASLRFNGFAQIPQMEAPPGMKAKAVLEPSSVPEKT